MNTQRDTARRFQTVPVPQKSSRTGAVGVWVPRGALGVVARCRNESMLIEEDTIPAATNSTAKSAGFQCPWHTFQRLVLASQLSSPAFQRRLRARSHGCTLPVEPRPQALWPWTH